MGGIEFSTCDPKEARARMERTLGKYAGQPESVVLMDAIEKAVEDGIIRVGDPFMYGGNAPVLPTEKCTQAEYDVLSALYKKVISVA